MAGLPEAGRENGNVRDTSARRETVVISTPQEIDESELMATNSRR